MKKNSSCCMEDGLQAQIQGRAKGDKAQTTE
jgi:hypothetical protein